MPRLVEYEDRSPEPPTPAWLILCTIFLVVAVYLLGPHVILEGRVLFEDSWSRWVEVFS